MLIIRNIILAIGFSLIVTGCHSETAHNNQQLDSQINEENEARLSTADDIHFIPIITPNDLEVCSDITDGNTLVSALPAIDIARNSFYLECTLRPFIGTIKVTQQDRDKARLAQISNASYLFSQSINPDHITRDGGRLLHMVIGSELNENEKIRWLERLVSDGADVNFMNDYGNEALRAARYQELPEIYDWLLENGAKANL